MSVGQQKAVSTMNLKSNEEGMSVFILKAVWVLTDVMLAHCLLPGCFNPIQRSPGPTV